MKHVAFLLFVVGLLRCTPSPRTSENPSTVTATYTTEDAEKEREHLVSSYIQNTDYTGFESEADGVNHLAFVTRDVESTIEFYTQVVRLKLLRIRAMDGDPASTQVFFDMGRGELLAFLRLNEPPSLPATGPFHHAALSVTREQYDAMLKRLDERRIPYTTISHEILDTITLTDPNGIVLELSVWKIDPKEVEM